MSFAVHTEKLNLVSALAAEENDEKNFEASLKEDESASLLLAQSFKIGSWQSHRYELTALMKLAIPTLAIQLGSVLPGFLIASYIGRSFEVEYLDGFTLASLTVNLFVLSLLQGLYSASDTLSPQAYGAGNMKEVGYLAIRGFAASMLIVLPIALLLIFYMKPVLIYVGEDIESATHAWRWYQIDSIAIPFYSLYQVSMKFLSAQNRMTPLVVCSMLSTCIVLPVSLWFFGGIFGFLGTAIAMVIYQVFQSSSLLVYLWWFCPHDPDTWPGFREGWKHAIQWKPFIHYMGLGLGGILASSEWIYWETLSLMIGTFGVIPLSVHTIPTQLIMVTFMGPLSLGIALSIRLGATLPVSVVRAKQTVFDSFFGSLVVFGLLTYIMYIKQDTIVHIFTTSDAVMAGCREIWWKVCTFNFLLAVYGVFMGICIGLGMQWTLGIATVATLWLVGLPMAYYLSVLQGGGINAAWSSVWPPYVVIVLSLAIAVGRADWNQIADDIRIREGVELLFRRPSTATSDDFIKNSYENGFPLIEHKSYGT